MMQSIAVFAPSSVSSPNYIPTHHNSYRRVVRYPNFGSLLSISSVRIENAVNIFGVNSDHC